MFYRRLKYSLVFFGTCLFLSVPALGQSIIYVNHAATAADNGTSWTDAFITLQDALLAAQSGDEIWVAAGTYRPDQGHVVDPGDNEVSFDIEKEIHLLGGFHGNEIYSDERNSELNPTILSGDLLGNDPVVFDGGSELRNDNSKHVILITAEFNMPPPSLSGFIISGGHSDRNGGGVYIEIGAHANLSDLVIKHNYADVLGGGLVSLGTFSISGSTFFENRAVSGNMDNGGAIYHDPSYNSDGLPYPAKVESTLFQSNYAGGCGGALTVLNGKIFVTNSTFIDNYSDRFAGAVCIRYANEHTSIFAGIRFFGNTARARGGAVLVDATGAHFFNSIFSANTAIEWNTNSYGGAIAVVDYRGSLTVGNSTFVRNRSYKGAAIWNRSTSSTTISNSLFWDNESDEGAAIATSFVVERPISYSLVEGGIPVDYVDAGGNLDVEPMLVDPDGGDDVFGTADDDLRLSFGSPAIDAGSNTSVPADSLDLDQDGLLWEKLPVDLDMNVRVFDGGSGTATVDIGAYEYGAPPIVLADDYVTNVLPESMKLLGNYPNPFNPSTTITYSLTRPSEIRLEVFDLLGKRVRVLERGLKATGEYEVIFEASGLPSGVYFYTLTTGDFRWTRKMVVVK